MSFKVNIDVYGNEDDLTGCIIIDMINVKPVSIVWKLSNSNKQELMRLLEPISQNSEYFPIIGEEDEDDLHIYEMNKKITVQHIVSENYTSYSSLNINFTFDQMEEIIEDIIKYEKYFLYKQYNYL